MGDIEKVKARLGIMVSDNGKNAQLTVFLSDAESIFLDDTKQTVVPDTAVKLIEQMAAYLYTSRSKVKAETEGDMTVTHLDGWPHEIESGLRKYRRVMYV